MADVAFMERADLGCVGGSGRWTPKARAADAECTRIRAAVYAFVAAPRASQPKTRRHRASTARLRAMAAYLRAAGFDEKSITPADIACVRLASTDHTAAQIEQYLREHELA